MNFQLNERMIICFFLIFIFKKNCDFYPEQVAEGTLVYLIFNISLTTLIW